MSWWMWGILIEFCALILVFLFLEGAFGDHRKRRERRSYFKELLNFYLEQGMEMNVAVEKASEYVNQHREWYSDIQSKA